MITLKVIGVLYVLSGLWCMFRSELAGTYVGYDMANPLAQAEFMTVYGGLQLGLGFGMLLGAMSKDFAMGSLFIALVFSVTLLGARLVSMAIHPEALVNMGVLAMAKLEFVIAAALGWAFYRARRSEENMALSAAS